MADHSPNLQIAINAAKAGAKEALKYFDKNIAAELKEDKTPVTIADQESEKAIIEYITSQIPDSQFVAEESGGDRDKEVFWIIDPVDGTRSFSRGVPTWCVLIALYEKGEVILGVCYYPVLDTLFWAEKGKGAYQDGKKISVSQISELKKAYVGYGSIQYFKDKERLLNLLAASGSSRSPDSTYAATLVASGKFDSHIDAYAFLWDAAPFKVIIEEAGGKITNLQGEPWNKNDRGYIATNGLLHTQVVNIVRS